MAAKKAAETAPKKSAKKKTTVVTSTKKGFDISSSPARDTYPKTLQDTEFVNPSGEAVGAKPEKKKRESAPKRAKAPKHVEHDEEEDDGDDGGGVSDELSPRALELIEFETEVRNAILHLSNEYKGDAKEHEPIRCQKSRKTPGPAEVFRTVESLRVGLTPEEQLARGKLAAVAQQNLARIEQLRGGVTKALKKLEKLYVARVEALLKTVDEGHADVPVTVVHVIDKATDRVQVIRCDTISVMSTRDLTIEERQSKLPGVQ